MAHQLVQRRVPAGKGQTCVAQFDHQIDLAQLTLQQPLGFGHMPRIPLNLHLSGLPSRRECSSFIKTSVGSNLKIFP